MIFSKIEMMLPKVLTEKNTIYVQKSVFLEFRTKTYKR